MVSVIALLCAAGIAPAQANAIDVVVMGRERISIVAGQSDDAQAQVSAPLS